MSRERPILFSGAMVRAILEGSKMQTRRIVKLPRWMEERSARLDIAYPDKGLGAGGYLKVPYDEDIVERVRCPYGDIGDRLWVRETWAAVDKFAGGNDLDEPISIGYRADLIAICHEHGNAHALDTYAWNWEQVKWRPSLFMPRWASRITLEIADVRVERLQDIGEDDARAEGVEQANSGHRGYPSARSAFVWTYKAGFEQLWDTINAKRAPWASNPWCWVISFKRIDAKNEAA